jgi:hypothetical protein
MSTLSAKPAERRKKRGKATSILGLVILLWLLAGCNVTGTGPPIEFSMIERPSAIRHFVGESGNNPDNLANYQVGFYRDNGLVSERPLLDGGTMWSYPRGDLGSMPTLRGAVFSIDLVNEYSRHGWILKDDYSDIINHGAVLEFRFPEATDPGGTEIKWFVTPHLVCTYTIWKSDMLVANSPFNTGSPDDPIIWFEYLVYEDPLGMLDLVAAGEAGWPIVSSGGEHEQEYIFSSDTSDGVSGTLLASNDERSGTMIVPQGIGARLFVGVIVQMRVYAKGDRIQIGGNSLPTRISDTERCTLSFGSNSYYTMQSAGDD